MHSLTLISNYVWKKTVKNVNNFRLGTFEDSKALVNDLNNDSGNLFEYFTLLLTFNENTDSLMRPLNLSQMRDRYLFNMTPFVILLYYLCSGSIAFFK